MYKNDRIDRFSGDVDDLLRHGSLSKSAEAASTEYAEMLALAEMLSSTDFSHQSQVRQTLRRRLLTKPSPREGWRLTERLSMVTQLQKRSIALALPAVILVALMIVALVWPSVVTAAVQSAVSFAQRLWVGEHTFVEPIEPEEITITEDGRLTMLGRIVDESGETAGQIAFEEAGSFEIEVRSFNSIAAAQAAAPFTLRQPIYLPEGYSFSKASVWGNLHVNFHYAGPDGDLLYIQRPVGEGPDQSVSIGLPEDYVIETIQVNGQDATWSEHVLLWEVDGFSYLLSSPDLNQLDAVRFAESLE